MLNLPQLHMMPSLEENDGDYCYNEKYQNKLYNFEDKIIYFQKSSKIDIPTELINTVVKSIQDSMDVVSAEDFIELTGDVAEQNTDINEKLDSTTNIINDKLHNIQDGMSTLNTALPELSSRVNSNEESIIGLLSNIEGIQSKAGIEKIVDEKLKDVYENFSSVTEKLVTERIDNGLKGKSRDAGGKVKLSSLTLLREEGFTTEQIIEMGKEGLI
jgi:hypothetical protein